MHWHVLDINYKWNFNKYLSVLEEGSRFKTKEASSSNFMPKDQIHIFFKSILGQYYMAMK